MKNTLETRLGIFVALAVIAGVLIVETLGGVEFFKRGYHLLAEFNNVADLKIGDRVKISGVEVGRVESINLDETNNKVKVTMKLRNNVIVRTDSTATIKFTGLLGQNFVAVDFGTPGAPRATENTLLKTVEQPDLTAVMQKIDNVAAGAENLFKSFSGFSVDKLLGPLTDFVSANKEPLTLTISNIQAVSHQIASGQGTIGRLIYDDSLYNTALATVTNLQEVSSEAKLTLADARQIIDQAKTGKGTVGKLLTDDRLYNEATATMTNAREILEKVNHGQGAVGKLINDQEFYRNAKLTLQKLDKATEGLEDQGPLSVLGIVVNNLF